MALRARAREERVTLGELATGMLERELTVATMQSWLRKRAESSLPGVDVDSIALLDQVREDYDRR